MPASIHASFQGTAAAFQNSLSSEPFLILAAIITVYIVLGVLYESYIHPITILSTLPSAGVGAILALQITHNDLTVVALIGIILCARSGARGEQAAAGSDISSVFAALPPHHDDDDGGAARRFAAGARFGNGRGVAAPPGHHHCGRVVAEPVAHALHHAGGLPVV